MLGPQLSKRYCYGGFVTASVLKFSRFHACESVTHRSGRAVGQAEDAGMHAAFSLATVSLDVRNVLFNSYT